MVESGSPASQVCTGSRIKGAAKCPRGSAAATMPQCQTVIGPTDTYPSRVSYPVEGRQPLARGKKQSVDRTEKSE